MYSLGQRRLKALRARLPDVATLRLRGADTAKFLQGMVTANADELLARGAGYTAWLNPKGRFLFETLVLREAPDSALLLTHRDAAAPLLAHVQRYKLRSRVEAEDATAAVGGSWVALFGAGREGSAARARLLGELSARGLPHCEDPRLPALGVRVLLREGDSAGASLLGQLVSEEQHAIAYHALRTALGVAEGERELQRDQHLPLESNLHWLGGVSFTKGCYLGQELTARTHFKGVIRKRFFPVLLTPADEPAPSEVVTDPAQWEDSALPWFLSEHRDPRWAAGSTITQEGRTVATLSSRVANVCLAMLRIEDVDRGAPLFVGEGLGQLRATPYRPAWWPREPAPPQTQSQTQTQAEAHAVQQ